MTYNNTVLLVLNYVLLFNIKKNIKSLRLIIHNISTEL